jgi:hypothetical protein
MSTDLCERFMRCASEKTVWNGLLRYLENIVLDGVLEIRFRYSSD